MSAPQAFQCSVGTKLISRGALNCLPDSSQTCTCTMQSAQSVKGLGDDKQQSTHTPGANHKLALGNPLQRTLMLSLWLCLPALGSL